MSTPYLERFPYDHPSPLEKYRHHPIDNIETQIENWVNKEHERLIHESSRYYNYDDWEKTKPLYLKLDMTKVTSIGKETLDDLAREITYSDSNDILNALSYGLWMNHITYDVSTTSGLQ